MRRYGRLRNVNTTDVHHAIRLGCRCMQSVFNADDNDVPFFKSVVRPDAYLAFSWAHSEAHVPGRHLNALLNAEDAIGVAIEPAAVDKHRRAAFFSFSGPLPLPLNRHKPDGPLHHFLDHNVREGLHALYALVRFRSDDEARRMAERCIETILEKWDPQRGWSIARDDIKLRDDGFVVGVARALGPLVKYHRAAGSSSAIELAHVLRDKLLAEVYLEDGRYDRDVHGTHTHSTTCVMSSLAQLADLENDQDVMQRVKQFYDHGLGDISDELGWVIESSGGSAPSDRGECNNTGDIVETALILGRHYGPAYFRDAERIVRSHLLPSQLRDTDFIVDPPNPDGVDGLRDVADRHLGAFGFPAPYGHEPIGVEAISFNMDIVGGAVASLCEVARDMSSFADGEHHVNLLFDHETDALRVQSPDRRGTLRVTLKQAGSLFVRGDAVDAKEGESVEIPIEMKQRDIVLKHRERAIRVRMRGESVEAMDNFDADLTFFDPLED